MITPAVSCNPRVFDMGAKPWYLMVFSIVIELNRLDAIAICYNIRYFERHGRALEDPWSCRQTAIHVKVSLSTRKTSSVIVQAPKDFRKAVSTVWDENYVHPLHTHLIYLSSSLGGWRDYLNYIADRLRDLVSTLRRV